AFRHHRAYEDALLREGGDGPPRFAPAGWIPDPGEGPTTPSRDVRAAHGPAPRTPARRGANRRGSSSAGPAGTRAARVALGPRVRRHRNNTLGAHPREDPGRRSPASRSEDRGNETGH